MDELNLEDMAKGYLTESHAVQARSPSLGRVLYRSLFLHPPPSNFQKSLQFIRVPPPPPCGCRTRERFLGLLSTVASSSEKKALRTRVMPRSARIRVSLT